jgi:catechol 2,3-dioxygenase-like lactoylglutathione lyase family enzyme
MVGAMPAISPHLVVRDAARAAAWYVEALGANERSRIPLPGGKLMSVELGFGDTTVMLADEFPELGVLAPPSIGGSPVALHLTTDDVGARCVFESSRGERNPCGLVPAQTGGEQGSLAGDPLGGRGRGTTSRCGCILPGAIGQAFGLTHRVILQV